MQLTTSNIARIETACNTIVKVMDDPTLRSRFPNVRLLRSSKEIEATRKSLPSVLLPFMIELQPTSADVYAFEVGDEVSDKVVVWNDHAIVADWSRFEDFVNWLCGNPPAK